MYKKTASNAYNDSLRDTLCWSTVYVIFGLIAYMTIITYQTNTFI